MFSRQARRSSGAFWNTAPAEGHLSTQFPARQWHLFPPFGSSVPQSQCRFCSSRATCVQARASSIIDRRIQPQFYFLIVIPTGWSQRHPFFPRTTGKEIFREIWSIDGRCPVCAEHDDRSLVLLATQHFCRREPGGTPSNDDDARRQGCGQDKVGRLKPAEPGSDVVDDGADHAGGKRSQPMLSSTAAFARSIRCLSMR